MVADWSELPSEIIYQVAQEFKSSADVITFTMVCRNWEYPSSKAKAKWNSKTPWIMLPELGEDIGKIKECLDFTSPNMNLIVNNKHPHQENPECIRRLFDPVTGNLYHLKLPELCSRKCFCSPYGLVLTIGLDLEVNLFNPITKSQVALPPFWTMPEPSGIFVMSEYENISTLRECDRIWMRTCFIVKGMVFKLPQDEETFVAMILEGHTECLAFARPGDNVWTPVDITGVLDAVYWNGIFLIVDKIGKLFYFDYVDSLQAGLAVTPKKYEPGPEKQVRGIAGAIYGLYLLVANDDIYVIYRDRIQITSDHDDDCISPKTRSFTIFKLDREGGEWQEVKYIGNTVILVGNGATHADFFESRWKSNSIIFMDDIMSSYRGGYDMGVYNIGTGYISSLYDRDDMSSMFYFPFNFRPSFV